MEMKAVCDHAIFVLFDLLPLKRKHMQRTAFSGRYNANTLSFFRQIVEHGSN